MALHIGTQIYYNTEWHESRQRQALWLKLQHASTRLAALNAKLENSLQSLLQTDPNVVLPPLLGEVNKLQLHRYKGCRPDTREEEEVERTSRCCHHQEEESGGVVYQEQEEITTQIFYNRAWLLTNIMLMSGRQTVTVKGEMPHLIFINKHRHRGSHGQAIFTLTLTLAQYLSRNGVEHVSPSNS